MEAFGSVDVPKKPRRKRVKLTDASIDAPAGTDEHKLALKRQFYEQAIPAQRGKNVGKLLLDSKNG